MKKLLLAVLCLMLCGCGTVEKKSTKLQIVTSIFPMTEFVKAVGGDCVEVIQMVPEGVEPHDWEPTAKDLARLAQARLFVYNGGVEQWAGQALQAVQEKPVVAVCAGKKLLDLYGWGDPHTWVSPRRAIEEVKVITSALLKADPQHGDVYTANEQAFLQKLFSLHEKYGQLGDKKQGRKTFVTAHRAFGQLASDYNLRMVAIAGLNPEVEPAPADLQRVMAAVRKNKVRYVFFESLTSPKLAEMLAKETGIRTAVLDPLEGRQPEDKRSYYDIQCANLASLNREFVEN